MADGTIVIDTTLNTTQAQAQMQQLEARIKNFGDGLKAAGTVMTGAFTVPLVAIGTASIKSAREFESAFAGVTKTVDATDTEIAGLEKGFRQMAKEMPQSAAALADVGAAAGQLGIEVPRILDFTKTMAMLGDATNLSSEEAATSLAKFANITQMSQQDFDRLGSTIVGLGNNFATTEKDIVEMGLRLAGTGNQIGLTEHEIFALGTAMSSVGINAEAGGTAFSTIMTKINSAVKGGGKEMESFAEIAGYSGGEFVKVWNEKPIQAIDAFVKGLDKTGKSGQDVSAILGEMGIKGSYERDTLLRLAGASGVLSDAINVSSESWRENTALTNEAEARYATFDSQMGIFKNKINDAGITLGTALLPVLSKFIDMSQPLIDWITKMAEKFAALDPAIQQTIFVVGAVLAVVGPLLIAFGAIATAIGALAPLFVPLVAAFGFVSTAISTAGGLLILLEGAFMLLISPIGLVVAAFALFVAGLVKLYNSNEEFRNKVNAIWESIKTAMSTALDAIWSVVQKVMNSVINFSKQMLDKLKQYWDENGASILNSVNKAFDAIVTTVKGVFEVLKGIFQAFFPVIKGYVEVGWALIKSAFSVGVDLILGVVKVFTKLLQGDWNGAFNAIVETTKKVLKTIVNTFKGVNLLQIGKDMVNGLVNGIKSMASGVGKAVKGLADLIPTGIKKILDIHSPSRVTTKLGEFAGQGMANGITNKNKAIETAANKAASSAQKGFNQGMQKLQFNYKAGKIDTTEYIASLKKMKSEYASVPNSIAKVDAQIASLRTTAAENKKAADQKELEEKRRIHNDLLKINEEYVGKIESANNRLIEGEKALNTEYNKALTDRTNALTNFAGIFDLVENKAEISGQTLITNLQSQVTAFSDWSADIKELAAKGIDEGLLKTLQEMGPKSAAEIAALNGMTEEELTKYTELWRTKNALAKEQATTELRGLATSTKMQITALRLATAAELTLYQTEWQKKIKGIKDGAEKEFVTMKTTMPQIGKDAISGLMDGMKDMEGPLMKQAQSMADAISGTIKKALDIHSPSRVLKDLGQWSGQGLINGLASKTRGVISASQSMADATISAFTGNTVGSSDNSRSYAATINNTYTTKELTAYEVNRLQTQGQRRLAMEWGI